MKQLRMEQLADGIFAIVMTLLIIEVKVPHIEGEITNSQLWHQLGELWPIFRSYFSAADVSYCGTACAEDAADGSMCGSVR